MKILKAVFPGSFDPLTNGHIDIIRRALGIFDIITVGVLSNPSKATLFNLKEREALIKEEFKDCKNRVLVESFSGLLVDFVRKSEARVIIRGLRAISDYDYEAQMALMNKNLAGDVETFFMITSEQNSYISSTLVKHIANFKGDVSKMVSPHIEKAMKKKSKRKK
ncbi:MAG: pantetheine-phosphate adenylyltransferase [bacterium]|nr:pantetheine-phosphate adenylyltransferase [bacterium]